MPIRHLVRATLKPKPSPVAKLPLLTPDLTPDDRVSNFDTPPSEADEEDVDDLLARLGMRLEYIDRDARFAEWYAEVNKHLRAGSLADIWGLNGEESYKSPLNHPKIAVLGQRQAAKRKQGDALADVAPSVKRSRPTTAAAKVEPPAKRAVARKPAASTKATPARNAAAATKRTTAPKPTAKPTMVPKPAEVKPVTTTKQTATKPSTTKPATKPTSKPTAAVKPTAHRKPTAAKATAASKPKTPPAPVPPPARTRTFYARRAKATAEPAPVPAAAAGDSSILTPSPPSPDPTTLLTAACKVTRPTRSGKASAKRR